MAKASMPAGQRLEAARQNLSSFLADPDPQTLRAWLRESGHDPVALLRGFNADRVFPEALKPAFALAEQLQPGRFLLERYLLVEASAGSLEKLPDYPVAGEVKELMAEEYSFFAAPEEWIQTFQQTSKNYLGYASMALLTRFPAGQLQWEISGFPRSWLLQIPLADLPRVLFYIGARLKGFYPCFNTHIPPQRSRRPVLLESAANRSYYLMAESMRLQPEIRGIVTSSWLYSSETQEISPHLRWMNRTFLENGGLISHIGLAPRDAGFLEGSVQRLKLYESGVYEPRNGIVIWPRKNMLEWAERYADRKAATATRV